MEVCQNAPLLGSYTFPVHNIMSPNRDLTEDRLSPKMGRRLNFAEKLRVRLGMWMTPL
jgi:hypothetical protein